MPTGFCKGQSAVLGTYSTSKLLLAGNHYMSSSFLPPPLKKHLQNSISYMNTNFPTF